MLDSAIHPQITIQQISAGETNCAIQRIETYLLDSVSYPLNNWHQIDTQETSAAPRATSEKSLCMLPANGEARKKLTKEPRGVTEGVYLTENFIKKSFINCTTDISFLLRTTKHRFNFLGIFVEVARRLSGH